MFVFSDAENILEHVVQLFLAEYCFRRRGGGLTLLVPAPWILVAAKDLVKLTHPGANDRLFGQTLDVWKTADTALDVRSENIAEVSGREPAAPYHHRYAITAQEDVEVALHSTDECFVGRDR